MKVNRRVVLLTGNIQNLQEFIFCIFIFMKDNFSEKSDNYARYRPGFPPELFDFLETLLSDKKRAWDCGTGNGQVAKVLANFIDEVYATDISGAQLKQATGKTNIRYSQQPAENTNFPENYFDLITVAQAIHWFDFPQFYEEVKRVLKPSGYIAVMGYSLFKSDKETNKLVEHFHHEIVGPYWDPERKYLDEKYQTIPFAFKEIETPKFQLKEIWSLERLTGYLNTWSAVKHYEKQVGRNPVELIKDDLEKSFGKSGELRFQILLRLGQLKA